MTKDLTVKAVAMHEPGKHRVVPEPLSPDRRQLAHVAVFATCARARHTGTGSAPATS